MGVLSSIIRSSDDNTKPSKKSYWGYRLNIRKISVEDLKEKKTLLPSEKRQFLHELSGKEPVEEVIVLENINKKLGRLTTSQVKEILDDMGFNVDVLISGKHYSDFDAVMNIGGYSVPGWIYLSRVLSKAIPSKEKLLLSKLSPGKDRLHARIFEQNDGSWAMIAHTDVNWLTLNLKSIYKAHLKEGEGDYVTGTLMLFNLLKGFSTMLNENKTFRQKEIDRIVRKSFAESVVKKVKLGLKVN